MEWDKEGLETFFTKTDNLYRFKTVEGIKGQMIEKSASLFTLNDLDGNRIKLADFKGKIVILDFFGHLVQSLHTLVPHNAKIN